MTKYFLIIGTLASLASCTTHQQRGAGYGALGGAAIGAVAGDDRRDVARGAVIGAVAGTAIAAATEPVPNQPQGDPGGYQNSGGYDQPSSAPSSPRPSTTSGGYPYAEKTSNPDQVLSPYAPYNVIDVAGFRSGQLARDPSNQKIFRIP